MKASPVQADGAVLRVALSSRVRRAVPGPRLLARWARLAASGLLQSPANLSVRVVGAAEGRTLNRLYRGRDYATNVLSFGAPPAARRDAGLLGDVVLCAPVVVREARQQGKPLRAHWAHLVIHGTLHLLGFDHARARDATRMERRERRLLRSLGFDDPYQPAND